MKQYPLYPVDSFRNFDEFVEKLGEKYGSQPAISMFTRKEQEIVHTYQEFTDDVKSLREYLRIHGFVGKHIAIVNENSYEWVVVYFAVVACGAVAVCIDAEQPDRTIHQMLQMSDTDMAFAGSAYLEICRAVLPPEKLISFSDRSEDYQNYSAALAIGRSSLEEGKKSVYDISPETPAVIAFTSGTSSKPKPVLLTQKNLLQDAHGARVYVDTMDTIFTSLPLYHTYGMTCGVLSSMVDGSHIYLNGNLRTAIRDMRISGANCIMTVPLMMEAICNHIWVEAEKQGKDKALRKLVKLSGILRKLGIHHTFKALEELREKAFGRIQLAIVGGAALSQRVADQLESLGLQVLQGYGITECSPLVAVNRNKFCNTASVGPVLPELECRLVEGEVWIRGSSVMQGYYNSPELTAEVMEDGWFKTGDLGHLDDKGMLYITGRKKNLVVFKNGKKIAPEKLEELIEEIPLVKEVMVYGTASGQDADDIKLAASIYPDPDRTEGMSTYEILAELQKNIDAINSKLPFYQHVAIINIRTTPFERTGTKKIKRYGNT